jgi:hypothetical protein
VDNRRKEQLHEVVKRAIGRLFLLAMALLVLGMLLKSKRMARGSAERDVRVRISERGTVRARAKEH